MELLPCVEMGPEQEAEGAVVWMHGLGASGHDFEDVVPLLRRPRTRFVFPHAPRRAVTLNMGLIMPAWYDIRTLGGPRDDDERGIRDSQRHIEALLAREVERGVPAQRIVVAGFSQGGAMALHVGLRYPETLAGILVLSAYELLPETRAAEASPANQATPALVCHGTYDPMVPVAGGREVQAGLAANGRPVEWHEFPMEHQLCLEEIEVIARWLDERLPAEP